MFFRTAAAAMLGYSALAGSFAYAEGYEGVPRTYLFNPAIETCFKDTSAYKKEGPYTIGFSNAGLGDSWRVVMQHSMQREAAEKRDQIAHLIMTDAGHDDAKQAADIQDLIAQGVDLLIVSANTAQALDPAVSQAMAQGIPVVMVDRRVSSDNFVTFVTASDAVMGRVYAQWIVEKLGGKGNVVMLGGQAGSSVSADREKVAKEVFAQYPGIKVLDTVYADWSPVKGKEVMQAMITKYGKDINAVWVAHGLMTAGSIQAFIDAGFKDGEIPLHTNADVNGGLQLAVQHDVPLVEVGYPPAMGGVALDVALQVLQGAPVPCTYTINAQIGVTKGDETASVKADRFVEDMVIMDGAPDMLITGGMGPDYDPSTYTVDYPK